MQDLMLVFSFPFPFLSLVFCFLSHVCWCVQELEKRYEQGLPRLDPVEDMNIVEPAVNSAVRRIEQLEKELAVNEVFKVSLATAVNIETLFKVLFEVKLVHSNVWTPLRHCSMQDCFLVTVFEACMGFGSTCTGIHLRCSRDFSPHG